MHPSPVALLAMRTLTVADCNLALRSAECLQGTAAAASGVCVAECHAAHVGILQDVGCETKLQDSEVQYLLNFAKADSAKPAICFFRCPAPRVMVTVWARTGPGDI